MKKSNLRKKAGNKKSSNAKKTNGKNKRSQHRISPYRIFFGVIGFVLSFILIVGCFGGGLLLGTILGYAATAPDIDDIDFNNDASNSFVYDSKGNITAELKRDVNKSWIPYEEIPSDLINAFVAIEDKRFYEHIGFDLKGTINGFKSYAISLMGKGGSYSGGSTITQQLIKNLTGKDDQTPKRKVQEIWQAIQLEKQLTKEQILEQYLNMAPTGGIFYGIETAAMGYYNKNVRELSLAECASLAGITNYPENYKPTNDENIQSNLERTYIILDEMLLQKYITQEEYDKAKKENINFIFNPGAGKVKKTSQQSYYVDQVISMVINDLMNKYDFTAEYAEHLIYYSGLKIYTVQDPEIQQSMDDIYTNEEFFPVINPRTDEHPQSASVVIDPKTGLVRAVYGGFGEKEGMTFNRATQANRSPGSSIKPLVVYAPGIETNAITAATVLDDVTQHMDYQNPEDIYPRNYSYKNFGLTTVRDGLRNSRNVVAALLLRDFIGIETGLDYLKKVNLDRRNERYISIAMGGFNQGMKPLEMASAYTVFANKGIYSKPIFYTRVEDQDGNVLLENKPQSEIVYSEETIYIMNDMLQNVVTNGTAYPYGIIKNSSEETIPTAGKTGTTSDYYDKWFCGYSPYYVAVVWYGYDTPVPLYKGPDADGNTVTEHNQALKIWQALMTDIHKELTPIDFPTANDIVTRTICKDSGKIATDLCQQDERGDRVYTEIFKRGTEPEYYDTCAIHYLADICTETKDGFGRDVLVGPNCPKETTEQKVKVKRPVPYKPEFDNDKYPEDWNYFVNEDDFCWLHNYELVQQSLLEEGKTPTDSSLKLNQD